MADTSLLAETPRLYLHPLNPDLDSHCDFVVTLNNDPIVRAVAQDDRVGTAIPDRESARKDIRARQAERARTGFGKYLVSLKPATPKEPSNDRHSVQEVLEQCEIIGTVSLKMRKHAHVMAPTVPDVGYGFMPQHWSKGYASEAAKGLLDYFERERGVRDVFGYCHPGNEASSKVLKKLGFEFRGVYVLKFFDGVSGSVWAKPHMARDLLVYGLEGERIDNH